MCVRVSADLHSGFPDLSHLPPVERCHELPLHLSEGPEPLERCGVTVDEPGRNEECGRQLCSSNSGRTYWWLSAYPSSNVMETMGRP